MEFTENIIEVFFKIDIDTHDPKKAFGLLESCSIPELDEIGASYQHVEIPEGAFYLAVDTNYRRIFALFSNPYSLVFGPKIGNHVLQTTMENIHQYTRIQPPSLPKPELQTHHDYKEWLPVPPQPGGSFPKSPYGIYYWGVWIQPQHQNRPPVLTPDITRPAARVQPMLQDLFQSLGNITQVKSVLLGALDSKQRNLMRSTTHNLPPWLRLLWKTSQKECFSLRACSVNISTRPHLASSDISWEMLAPLGKFSGGQLCIADLKRSFNYTPGSIGGIRGSNLVQFIRMWEGSRICLVSTMHTSLQSWVLNNPSTSSTLRC